MGAAILENMPVTRSKDSTLFREISREIFAVRVDRTATCVGFREISREMLWPNARLGQMTQYARKVKVSYEIYFRINYRALSLFVHVTIL